MKALLWGGAAYINPHPEQLAVRLITILKGITLFIRLIIRLFQLVFSAGVFQSAYQHSWTAPLWYYLQKTISMPQKHKSQLLLAMIITTHKVPSYFNPVSPHWGTVRQWNIHDHSHEVSDKGTRNGYVRCGSKIQVPSSEEGGRSLWEDCFEEGNTITRQLGWRTFNIAMERGLWLRHIYLHKCLLVYIILDCMENINVYS
jgi:hypothetical protein